MGNVDLSVSEHDVSAMITSKRLLFIRWCPAARITNKPTKLMINGLEDRESRAKLVYYSRLYWCYLSIPELHIFASSTCYFLDSLVLISLIPHARLRGHSRPTLFDFIMLQAMKSRGSTDVKIACMQDSPCTIFHYLLVLREFVHGWVWFFITRGHSSSSYIQ